MDQHLRAEHPGGLDRCCRGGALQPRHPVRRHGFRRHPRQRVHRAGRVPVRRRRRHLAPSGPPRGGTDRAHPRPPRQRGCRVPRGNRPPLRPEPRAGRLPHPGRWPLMGERPLRLGLDRRDRAADERKRPGRALRGHVARGAQALDDDLGRAGRWDLSLPQRGRQLGEAGGWAPGRADRQAGHRAGRVRPVAPLRDHRGRSRARHLPLGRRGRQLGAGQRPGTIAGSSVVLPQHLCRPDRPGCGVRGWWGFPPFHRWRGDLFDHCHAPLGPSRPLDLTRRPGCDGSGERRWRDRDPGRRPHLVHPAQPAHRRDVLRDGGRSVPLPRVRVPAGQLDPVASERGHGHGDFASALGVARRLRDRTGDRASARPGHCGVGVLRWTPRTVQPPHRAVPSDPSLPRAPGRRART